VHSDRPFPDPVMSERLILSDCSIRHLDISDHPKILAVIVLYKCTINRSSTCISIRAQDSYDNGAVSCLIYDNSPIGNSDDLPPGWIYVSDPTNNGLASAYNHAISQAKCSGAQWLLLLDQDSCLPKNFMANLQVETALCHHKSEIAAIVPLVFSNNRQVSPFLPKLGFDHPYTLSHSTSSGWIAAINSAASIRISFLESIGGFSTDFWLDYLDHWLFRKIYDTGHAVFVGEMKVEHSLSVANFNHGLEVSRYRNVLTAEMAFTNRCLPAYWRPILAMRLIARAIKHALFTRDKRIALLIIRAALEEIVTTFGGILKQSKRVEVLEEQPLKLKARQ
jgi:GT2 family glycosyltransferase